MATNLIQSDPAKAYEDGRHAGLATAALALGVVSFVNLLGLEKPVLALVLAAMALRGGAQIPGVRRSSRLAQLLAVLHIVTIAVVLVVFRHQLLEFVTLLQKLS